MLLRNIPAELMIYGPLETQEKSSSDPLFKKKTKQNIENQRQNSNQAVHIFTDIPHRLSSQIHKLLHSGNKKGHAEIFKKCLSSHNSTRVS